MIYPNTEKKVLLYYFSSSELLAHADNALLKIRDTIDTFISSKDKIYVIWYRNPLLDDYLNANAPELLKGFKELSELFLKSECGILIDDPSEEDSLVSHCNAYYGSGGYLATSCLDAGKPVMIQDLSTSSSLKPQFSL